MILYLYILLLFGYTSSIIIQVTNYTLIENEGSSQHYEHNFTTLNDWSKLKKFMDTNEFNFVNITYTEDSEEIQYVKDYPTLEYFWLENVDQNSIPYFKNLPKLSILNLSKNNISTVTNNVISSVPVTKIYLNNNKIKDIEDNSFGDNLTNLSLNFNRLERFSSKWFKNPEKLYGINLVGNDIEYIHKSDFRNFVNIHKILLGFNKIKSIEAGSFGFRNYFYKLSLDYNQLVDINHIFGDKVKINKFYFTFNQLTYLSEDFLKNLEVVEEFWVYGNPWLCSYIEKINKTVDPRIIDWGDKYDVTYDVRSCENSTNIFGTRKPDDEILQKVIITNIPISKEMISYYAYNSKYFPCNKMMSCKL